MASINDNLFTTLLNYKIPNEIECRLLTATGQLSARFSKEGLSQLYYDDTEPAEPKSDSVFRSVFLQWIAHYQRLPPAAQWEYLSPMGTEFQKSVWRALIEVPCGQHATYQEIAKRINRPKAARAVGSAVGANPIALLIPCHRIVPASGAAGNYRWGADRKLALLDAEQALGSDLLQLFQ
jgi:O-6-methylguanine DNA methyltransferase